jgi:hypothetical protein
MNKFVFHSEQIYSTPKGTRRNAVNVVDNKGKKEVNIYNSKGKMRKSTKKLSPLEIRHIRENRFIPKLFGGMAMRSNRRKTRRRHN